MAKKREVYSYKVVLDMEVTVEAEDAEEASDAIYMWLKNEGLDNDRIDVEFLEAVPVDEFEGEIDISAEEER